METKQTDKILTSLNKRNRNSRDTYFPYFIHPPRTSSNVAYPTSRMKKLKRDSTFLYVLKKYVQICETSKDVRNTLFAITSVLFRDDADDVVRKFSHSFPIIATLSFMSPLLIQHILNLPKKLQCRKAELSVSKIGSSTQQFCVHETRYSSWLFHTSHRSVDFSAKFI